MRIRKYLAPVLAVPLSLAILGCSSVKQEKGPFKDDDWFDPATGTATGTGSGAGGEGSGTGGTGAGTTGTATGSGGAGGSGMGTGGSGTGGAGSGTGGAGSGTGGAGACQTFDYKNYQAPSAAVSFKTDIAPLVRDAKCTNNGCHSDLTMNPPRLGPSSGTPDAAQLDAMRKELLGTSVQNSALKIVSPGKPEESYLMNKIDGTFSCMGFSCDVPQCGQVMPSPANPRLDQDKISKVRAWIKQGAAAN